MLEEQSKEKQGNLKETTDLNSESLNEELHLTDNVKVDMANGSETDAMQGGKDGENSEKIAQVIARVIEQEFSGPIPPPNIIAGYENVVPGAADRIITMAEQQSSHRQQIQLMETRAEIRDSLLGVIFAFGLGIGCLIACVITVIMVPAEAGAICGSILGVTGIGSIVAAFLKNTRPSNK